MQMELAAGVLASRSVNLCNNVQTMIEIVAAGAGAALFPETMVQASLAECRLTPICPPPATSIHFQTAIRAGEKDPLVLEMFARASKTTINLRPTDM